MRTPDTITPEQWSTMVADANEAAGRYGEPDWYVAYVPGSGSHSPWLWYVALPMAGPDEDLCPFVAHQGAAPSRKAAVRRIGKHIEEYDARELGIDPRGPLLGAVRGSLLRAAGGLALGAALVALGAPVAVVWYCAAALVAGALAVNVVRRRRALGYQPID